MSSVVSLGSNIASLRTQRVLEKNDRQISRVSERLSSGQRIIRASDDAAGLSIAKSLEVKTRVITQAIRNASDGLSVLSIAQSARDQLTAITERQIELASQAANGTLALAQRRALETEANALSDEYNRILSTVSFNGRRLYDPNSTAISIQAGEGDENILNLAIGAGLTTQAGVSTTQSTVDLSAAVPGTPEVTTLDFSAYVVSGGGGGTAESTTISTGFTYVGNPGFEIQSFNNFQDGTTYSGGEYLSFGVGTLSEGNYYVWVLKDGTTGSDPGGAAGGSGTSVTIYDSDSASDVTSKVLAAMDTLAPGRINSTGATSISAHGYAYAGNSADPIDGGLGDIDYVTQGDNYGYNVSAGGYVAANHGGNLFYTWWTLDGVGSDPGLGGTSHQLYAFYHTDAAQFISNIYYGFESMGFANTSGTAIEAPTTGNQVDATTSDLVLSLSITDGASGGGGSPNITPGTYATFDTPTTDWYVWFSDGVSGSDPALGSRTGIEIDLALAGATAGDLATYVAAQITSAGFNGTAVRSGDTVVITNTATGNTTNGATNEANVSVSTTDGTAGGGSAVDQAGNTVTVNSHGLTTGQQVTLTTAGTLPTGLAAYEGQTLYAIAVNANTLAFATSEANADADSRIDISSAGSGVMTITAPGNATYSNEVAHLDFSTQVTARNELPGLQDRLLQIQTETSNQGASEQRLMVALRNLESGREAYEGARTQIESADIAQESAEYARLNILREVSTAVLAQANIQPQLALSLLRG